MKKLVKLSILMVAIAMFNNYLLHSEELDDKFKDIILNIPDMALNIGGSGRHVEFNIISKSEIDLDGNKTPDYIVLASYLDYGGYVITIIEDIKTPVFWDRSQFINDLQIIDDIIPNIKCLFYRSSYAHGFSEWKPTFVGVWPKPEILLMLDFNAIDRPGSDSDEENLKFMDLDKDGLKEIALRHVFWRNRETDDNWAQNPEHIKTEYKVFKYSDKKKQIIEVNDKKILKAARKLFDNEPTGKLYYK